MKRWLGAAALLLLLLAVFSVVLAQSGQFDLPWSTIDSGGGASSGGDYALQAAIGQPEAGVLTGGSYSVNGGFLALPVQAGEGSVSVFVPLVMKPS